jgi:hypothetical protein
MNLTAVHGWRSTYWKLRRRGALDFLCSGLRVRSSLAEAERSPRGSCWRGRVAAARVGKCCSRLIGRTLTDETIATAPLRGPARPMDNTD